MGREEPSIEEVVPEPGNRRLRLPRSTQGHPGPLRWKQTLVGSSGWKMMLLVPTNDRRKGGLLPPSVSVVAASSPLSLTVVYLSYTRN